MMNEQLTINKNFLFVVNTYKSFGGAERQALIFAEYIFKNVSGNVAFIAFEDGNTFKEMILNAGISAYYFPFKHHSGKLQKLWQYVKLIRFLRKLQPDILIPYVAESNKIVAMAWKYTGARFAFWNQRDEGRKLYGTKMERKAIRNVSAIVSNSYEGKEALVKTYGLNDADIRIINNGIIPVMENTKSVIWHEKLAIPKDRPIISMIANITNRKDHLTLIKAWQIVITELKAASQALPVLVLAGRKVHTYDKLRLLAFDLNLSDHIRFTGEIRDVTSLINESLFCVFSSNLEGCPNGVLECMAQRKVVIGTDISGIRQAISGTYEEYCLVQPNSPKEFAGKIVHLFTNSELKSEIEAFNLQRINNEFSVEGMVRNFFNIIHFTKAT